MAYWLVKSDPEAYNWVDFEKEKKTDWDGVRNYQARNNLKTMELGDEVFFYHSNANRAVIGIAEVTRTFYPDPTIDDDRWVAVEISVKSKLKNEVTLEQIKHNSTLANIPLIQQSRLSVMPITTAEWNEILKLSR